MQLHFKIFWENILDNFWGSLKRTYFEGTLVGKLAELFRNIWVISWRRTFYFKFLGIYVKFWKNIQEKILGNFEDNLGHIWGVIWRNLREYSREDFRKF